MLKFSVKQKQILDLLLTSEPAVVAQKLQMPIQDVYDAKHNLRAQVQNAREFLAVANSKYASLLTRRIKTPKITPQNPEDDEPLEIEKHQEGKEW